MLHISDPSGGHRTFRFNLWSAAVAFLAIWPLLGFVGGRGNSRTALFGLTVLVSIVCGLAWGHEFWRRIVRVSLLTVSFSVFMFVARSWNPSVAIAGGVVGIILATCARESVVDVLECFVILFNFAICSSVAGPEWLAKLDGHIHPLVFFLTITTLAIALAQFGLTTRDTERWMCIVQLRRLLATLVSRPKD